MNKIYICFLLFLAVSVNGQNYNPGNNPMKKKTVLTAGLLYGGGSLVGFDFEHLISNRVALQAGAGYIGYGGGINYHLKPSIESSFVGIQYYHQGVGSSHVQSAVGPTFGYRAKKLFTFSIGFAFKTEEGEAFDEYEARLKGDAPDAFLTYAIGIYFPL